MQPSPLLELFDLLHDSRFEAEDGDSSVILGLMRDIFIVYRRCQAVGLGHQAGEMLFNAGILIGQSPQHD